MQREVKFHPEFCEAIADGLNNVTMFNGMSTPKDVKVDVVRRDQPEGEKAFDTYTISVTPEMIMEFMPYHQKAQNRLLKEDDEFMFVANAPELPELLLILAADEIGVLATVADKILAGARGVLVPDLQGTIEVVENEIGLAGANTASLIITGHPANEPGGLQIP